MPARALAKTERVTGSSLPIVLLQYECAYTIDHAPPPWPDNARGLSELDYGRTLYLGTLAHLLTVQHGHLHPLPVEVGLPLSGPGVAPRPGSVSSGFSTGTVEMRRTFTSSTASSFMR